MCKYYCLYLLTVFGLASGAAQTSSGGCVLPGYPPHGTYTVYNKPEAVPGQVYDCAGLTVSCDPGYEVVGSNVTYCFGGNLWPQPMPQCTRFCRLTPDPSVNYYCKVTGDGIVVSGTRVCHELEPHGTEVVPECNRPFYYTSSVLLNMHCIDGSWDHVAVCQPDCGTPTPVADRLIINGKRTKHGELPWHAGVYDKTFTPYKQICGGSLISTRVIISAAHCFWNAERQEAASKYAVALGKIYLPWDDAMDTGAHKSDVSEIKIPVRYQGEAGHYQEDIALVFLSTAVVYRTFIRPVCIDFNEVFDSDQLRNTNSGKVAGWGLTAADGLASSPLLLTTDLPYVDATKCMAELPSEFRPHLTTDKFCAGTKNGTTVCQGDSGGGLVFPGEERGIRRYYLRGVVSTAPSSEHACNVNSYTTFTHVQSHATFIREYGLRVVSGRAENGTREYPPPDRARPVAPDGCPNLAPGRTTEPTGIKSWDKCLEYQMRLVYPCEESETLGGGKVRRDYCRHNVSELIVGRTDAERDEFPYMVQLGYGSDISSAEWLCVGALISDRFILTAAWCIDDGGKPLQFAFVGSYKRSNNVEAEQVYRIKRIIKHPDYDFVSLQNDIALLETDSIPLTQSIVPACLDVFGGDRDRAVATAQRFKSIGDYATGKISDTLQKMTLTKLTETECSDRHSGTFNSTTHDCYGYYSSTAGPCVNYDGAPLTIFNHRLHCMYTVVGVSNQGGRGCGTTTSTVLCTKVSPYVPWIESIVWP